MDAYGHCIGSHEALVNASLPGRLRLAAALRAAVVQCRYIDDDGDSLIDAEELLAIATELEAADG